MKGFRILPVLGILLVAFDAIGGMPQPSVVFGFEPGEDYRLASYAQMEQYYRALAAATGRVEMRTIGTSVLGRNLYLLLISSEQNLRDAESYRRASEALATGRISADQATALANSAKAVVWIDGGLHAEELAGAQMTAELAYRVASSESAEMAQIRNDTILLLMPVVNPDGLETSRLWYERNLGTDFEQTSPPELSHHFIGHDINRDFFINNMPESLAVSRVLYKEWFPQVVYNHHQMSPGYARIVIPPYSDPVNPLIHPGVTTGVNEIGGAIGNRFAMEGMPGAIADEGFSMWWNGGLRTVPYFHNMIGILTETAHETPSPRIYDPAVFPRTIAYRADPSAAGHAVDENDHVVPDAEIRYPYPWAGGESHFRDAIDYMLTGSIAVLRAASDGRRRWLANTYEMARDAIEAGELHPRHFVFPADQPNDDEMRNLVNALLEGGVEIDLARRPFHAGERIIPAGSFLIDSAQSFRPYILDLLEPQTYPKTRRDIEGEPKPPYDIAGWTLPMQMGVQMLRVDAALHVDSERVVGPVAPPPRALGRAARYGYAFSHVPNTSIRAVNSLLREGEPVYWSEESLDIDKQLLPSGTFVVAAGDEALHKLLASLAGRYGIGFVPVDRKPAAVLARLDLPRVGLYKSWVPSPDEGWTRWLLEDYGFDVQTLSDEDIRTGGLENLTAIILPHPDGRVNFRSTFELILNGYPTGTMPEEYVGGLGVKGALALQRFVANGGTLITFGESGTFAIREFGLDVRNVVEGASARDFSIPGSIIRGVTNSDDPVTYGMSRNVALTFVNGQVYADLGQAGCVADLLNQRHCREVIGRGRPLDVHTAAAGFDSIVKLAEQDILMSGWAVGAEHVAGKTVLARVRVGQGEVLLFGFRPQFRGQSRGTYKLLFNGLYSAAMRRQVQRNQ